MSISTEITRLQTARNTIRTKLYTLGLAPATAKLDECATAVENIEACGAVTANVKEGETYAIPRGYHNGSGTVSGVAGGGNYSLQSKTVTPTKKQQSITPDSGYYGLSDVTVSAIPEIYHDVSSVTASAANVLAGKIIVTAGGAVTAGTMPNIGKQTKTLSTSTTSYTIPEGYHNGTGTVSVVLETKEATPTKAAQNIIPTSGKVLSKVTVNAIPDEYITTSDATATAGNILDGKTAYVNGEKITGTMPNNGSTTGSFNVLGTTASYTIPAGYTTGGTVTITSDLENALAAI